MDGQPYGGRGQAAPAGEAPGYGPEPERPQSRYDAAVPPVDSRSRAVERSELAPVMARAGSGLPFEPWQGLDLVGAEKLLGSIDIPPPSPALHQLWRRLLKSSSSGLAGATPQQLVAIRAEGLYRSGLFADLNELLGPAKEAVDPLIQALAARRDLALGQRATGCDAIRTMATRRAELPQVLRGEMLVLGGYCGAAAGNPAAAGLSAELARDESYEDAAALEALDSVASGQPPRLGRQARISPGTYRLLALAKAVDPAVVLEKADATLLAVLVADPDADPRLRIAAAEAAVRLNAITSEDLAAAYHGRGFGPAEMTEPLGDRVDPLFRRALLLQAAEGERDPQKRARLIRALLDDMRRAGLYLPGLILASKVAAELPRTPEISWFAETEIEIALAAGDQQTVRDWVTLGSMLDQRGPGAQHWLALSDIASASFGARGASLGAVEDLARQGRFNPAVLQRLATVLDALDYNVPMGLWQAASSTPQTNDGYLPETGILFELQDASKQRQFARTILLAMRALGPKGAEGANIIALGDTIRALRRAGLEPEARRLGMEALFAFWPRTAHN